MMTEEETGLNIMIKEGTGQTRETKTGKQSHQVITPYIGRQETLGGHKGTLGMLVLQGMFRTGDHLGMIQEIVDHQMGMPNLP